MPAVIIKRPATKTNSKMSSLVSEPAMIDEDVVVVVVKDRQIEVYTDQEAETYINKD